jgi:HAMP domain-containing protein
VSWVPLKSLDGAVIGAMGVASPSETLNEGSFAVTIALLTAAGIGAITAGLCGFAFGEMLSSRLRALSEAVSRMSVGELSAEVRDRPGDSTNGVFSGLRGRLRGNADADANGSGPPERSDEISVLANQLEQMRGSFRMAIERLRRR